jgi:hypothetical protein
MRLKRCCARKIARRSLAAHMLIKKPENRSKVLVAGKSMAFADFTNAVLEFVRSYPTGPQSPFSPCARRIATVCFTIFPFCPILGGIGAIIGAADPQILWLIVAAADVGAALGLALLPLPRTDPQARAAAFLKRGACGRSCLLASQRPARSAPIVAGIARCLHISSRSPIGHRRSCGPLSCSRPGPGTSSG